ncbi:MAG TPA: dihydroorotase [Deltaproteobacteria bacterium]|nr:dihydroorotase [Deltaproteobacteria bacterium]
MWIKGARILDPENGIDTMGDIHVSHGRIAGIYPGGSPDTDAESIDAQGKWVLPGLIDMHVHLRDPGFEYKEDIASGSLAAAAGGVTTMVCMANTDPVNDNPSVTKYIIDRAKSVALVRIMPVGAVSKALMGQELSEMGLMKEAGIVAVSDDGNPVEDASLMRSALFYASTFGLPLLSHCQDRPLSVSGVMNEGALSSGLGLSGIPGVSEEIMVSRDLLLSRDTRVPIHLTHLSTKTSLELVSRAKEQGIPVTCDVTPHHLLLTEEGVKTYDTNMKMYPPLRTEEDRKALVEGLLHGIIDCVATDHAPHARDEKNLDFDLAPFGVIGLQTLLPALLKIHFENDKGLLGVLGAVTCNPARILGIDGGNLTPGSRADITIIDPQRQWVFTEECIRSKSKNSPFLGQRFTGMVIQTIVEGQTVFRES